MPATEKRTWSDEVRVRLVTWGAWAAGPQQYRNPMSPIAAMIRRAAGELPGDDISVPRELTFELEVTEKALARMKYSDVPRDRVARKLLLRIYLHGVDPHELEFERGWTRDRRQAEMWRAESIVGRYMIEVERDPKLLATYRKG